MQQEFGFEEPTFGIETAIRMLQSQMSFLGLMWIEGEVSEFTAYRGVHWYFTLKDFQNVKVSLKCGMFQLHTKGSRRPNVGDKILVQGEFKLNRGQTQFVVYKLHKMEEKGEHEIRLEQLRATLQQEGLLDEERKRPLPKFPRTIGVVTSRESAALQDVMKVLDERLPTAKVVLSDTTTEGAHAATEIVSALERLQLNWDCDVIIVTRGGGARESLMGFNDERVVRSIANCTVPVVCAVGHETDVTLAELVADLRASTPTKAAGEVARISEREIQTRLADIQERLRARIAQRIQHQQALLTHLRMQSPQYQVEQQRERLINLGSRFEQKMKHRLEKARVQLSAVSQQLDSVAPQRTLEKGFGVVTKEGVVITQASQVQPGDRLKIQLAEGVLEVQVLLPQGMESDGIQLQLPFM